MALFDFAEARERVEFGLLTALSRRSMLLISVRISVSVRKTMEFILEPWQFYFLILAGWVNRQQQQVIEYLRAENQVLREIQGSKRLLLNDDQRRRLAAKGKVLGRKLLNEVGTLFTRTVHFAGCSTTLGDDFMKQIGRNLTDPVDGFLTGKAQLLMDRDANFSAAFRTILAEAGVNPVQLPPTISLESEIGMSFSDDLLW